MRMFTKNTKFLSIGKYRWKSPSDSEMPGSILGDITFGKE